MSKSSIRDDVESFATKDPNKNKLSPNMDLNTISFSSIFDNFYDGVIITDANGFIVYYNKTRQR